jgi:tRNA-specific 2-thiouridylase
MPRPKARGAGKLTGQSETHRLCIFFMTAPRRCSVIVGLSGGVDSAVAAHLLLRAGYRVQGLFMKNWDEDDGTEYCTAREDLADAEQVAAHLGIPLHTANFAAEYWDNVFEDFLAEYSAGRTPNPDILCNREIKFRQFVDYAASLGADLIATGHYARGIWPADQDPVAALQIDPTAAAFRLLKGVDPDKDQTYFLQAVPRAQLARCLFPLGTLEKRAVRDIARREGLHNHRRKDSTGICFIGERRFRDFLQRYLPVQPGPIHDRAGRCLGQHQGLAYYTLGQRQGLGIGGVRGQPEAPWYVMAKDLSGNTLIVTQDAHDLETDWLVADRLNWLVPTPALPLDCSIRVRYRQKDQPAVVTAAVDGTLLVRFRTPQRAVTPGQYVGFYQHELCLGGGQIQSTGRAN